MRRCFIVFAFLFSVSNLPAPLLAQERPPIIDMHMHADLPPYDVPAGQPALCRPEPCVGDGQATASHMETLEKTLEAMERYNIVKGFLSGVDLEVVEEWVATAPGRFIASPFIVEVGRPEPEVLRRAYAAEGLGGMGEIATQLTGVPPNDPRLEPYFALAEKFDVPVLIHTAGIGPYMPGFRSAAGDPLLMEEVLVRHPKLRLYVENAGYPYRGEMIAMMYQYPQLYADVSTITWVIPRTAFYDYLEALVRAGLGKRLMFGSDQMRWPGKIGEAIEAIEEAPFLTEEQKRDILYDNAVRFLQADTALGQAGSATVEGEAYGEDLGTVQFPVSCEREAQAYAERGLALLHHMTYEGSRAAFASATEADSDCAMGYWGQAMTFIHPLWSDPPSEADFQRGKGLVSEARARGGKADWERAYISAVEAYYAEGRNRDEKHNLAAFEEGWREVHEQFPEDPEAAAFYALVHMATADPEDKTFEKQKQAAEIAKQVLARHPDHPGAHHYVIHAYDYPPLAEEALEVARSYGEIAPEVPHALHMPGHVFTRLGLWQESIEMNQRSAAAALEHSADDKVSMHYLHALDYLGYAHLQRGEDDSAREVLNTIEALEEPVQPHIASAYTFAAVPARFALERHAWDEAASLEARRPREFPWDAFPAMEAISHFARALGAARSGNETEAQQAIGELAAIHEQAAEASDYWAKQVEIQRLAAEAWLAHQQGDQQEALDTMKRAARLEASTEKHPVTPGEVLPARELYGDMLLDAGRYEEAQAEYEAALERSPRRFNSLYGAGRAAELNGDDERAAGYYKELVEVAADDADHRKRFQEAKQYLADTDS